MTVRGNGRPRYQVHCSTAVNERIQRVHHRAERQGRGPAMTRAFRRIVSALEKNPWRVGEPTHRLPALRLQIRITVVPPIVVAFGICEDRPIVWIRSVKLLSL